MKKIISLILVALFVFTFVSCNESNPSETESAAKEPSTEELKEATLYIALAETSIDQAAAIILDNWTTNTSAMMAYFGDTSTTNSDIIKDRAESLKKGRELASEKLTSSKALLGSNGSSEHYQAVKKYYIAVNSYLSLVSDFPNGYSKLTYSQAVSQQKSACQEAYEEVLFYNN